MILNLNLFKVIIIKKFQNRIMILWQKKESKKQNLTSRGCPNG